MRSKELTGFLAELSKCKIVQTKYKWEPIRFKDDTNIKKYWSELSSLKKKIIIRDPYWNNYPYTSYSYSSGKRIYGTLIKDIVSSALLYEKDRKILKNHAEGLFAVVAFEDLDSQSRKYMVRRMLRSSDKRCLTRAIDAASNTALIKVLKEWTISNTSSAKRSLSYKIINKIGFDNCYKLFLPPDLDTFTNHTSRRALRCATRKDIEYLISRMSEDFETLNQFTVTEIVKRLSLDEIIINLDKICEIPKAASYARIMMDGCFANQ